MTEILENSHLSIEDLLREPGINVLASIRDPFGVITPDYTILWMNKAMGYIHGKPHDGGTGKVCHKYFYNKSQPCEDCPLRKVFSTGKSCITEKYLDFPDGIRRWGEVKAYPVRKEENSLDAAIVIVFDITARKDASEKIKQSTNIHAQKSDNKKGEAKTIKIEEIDITIKINLTRREKEVLNLLIEGLTNTQIAGILNIRPSTVKSHIISIFNKLGVNDRTQAAVMAIRYNLI